MDIGQVESLEAFKTLLVNRGILTDKEAEAYSIVISMGQPTATVVHRRLQTNAKFRKIAKQTTHTILNNLCKKGFVKRAIASGKRGHPSSYRAVSPEFALSDHFNETERLRDVTEQIVALMESKSEEESVQDQNLWISEPQKVALREGLKILENAKKSILIHCNDYSWAQLPRTIEVLKKKMRKNLDVRILGGVPHERLKRSLGAFKEARRQTDIPSVPYCLIDEEQVILFLSDVVSSGYKMLSTKNIYIVERYSAFFKKIWEKYSKEA